ncbi:MAG TPA: hypothetical protein VGK19_15735 [Capsulimonadaceae bacterium]|jgi:hypothetical protein
MKKSSRNALLLAIGLVVGFILYRVMFPTPPSDTIQIQQQIKYAVESAQTRNVGGIMRVISPHYMDDNGFGSEGLQLSLRRAFNNLQVIEIAASPSSITIISPTVARSETYFGLKCQGNQGSFVRPQAQITLDWKKEDTQRYLFFTVKEWHVVRASYGSFTFDL